MHSKLRATVLLVCAAVAAWSAWSDTLYLGNGDRLSGQIESIRDGKITLKTDYAGTVNVEQSSVVGMTTDDSLAVKDKEGAIEDGCFSYRNGGQYFITGDGEREWAVPAVAIAAKNRAELLPSKQRTWKGTIEAGASWRSGNTDTLDSNLRLSATRSLGKGDLALTASAGYGEVEGEVNTRRYKGEAKLKQYPDTVWYWYVLLGLEHDEGRKLELRAHPGLGFGYDVIKRETLKLSLEAGFNYTYERWNLYTDAEKDDVRRKQRGAALDQVEFILRSIRNGSALTSERVSTAARSLYKAYNVDVDETRTEDQVSVRLASHYEQQLFKNATVTEDLTILPEVDPWGEYRLTSELALTTPLSESLSLRLSLKSEYDTDPGDDVDKWDHLFISGITYKF